MTWQPERPIQIVAGTPPGGGLDRVARALEKAIAATRRCDAPIEIVNVPGGGARKAWTDYIDKYPADGHVIGISSPNLTTDYLVGAARLRAFEIRADRDAGHRIYRLCGQIGFAA